MKTVVKLTANVFYFGGGPLLLLLIGLLLYLLYPVLGPIRPKEAKPRQILLWIAVRDLPKQSPETIASLLQRVEELYGPHSGSDAPMTFELSDFFRNIVSERLLERRSFLETYQLQGIGGVDFSFLLSAAQGNSETSPSEGEKSASPVETPKTRKKSLSEKNVVFLFKCWYLREMNAYEQADSEKAKKEQLAKTIEELKWWNAFYLNLFTACEIPKPTLMEMSKEFELTFKEFRETGSEEEYRRIVAFKDVLQNAYIYTEVHSRMEKIFSPFFK